MKHTESKPAPKYVWLTQKLKADIELGRLNPGDQLPSFAKFQQEYGATTTTVERVLSLLERDGLVERINGKGSFVRQARKVKSGAPRINPVLNKSVAVLNHGIRDHRFSSLSGWPDVILSGIMDRLHEKSLHALTINDFSSAESMVTEIAALAPYGVVLPEISTTIRAACDIARGLSNAGLQVAAYGVGDGLTKVDRVVSDYETGSYELTQWLIARGRRRIINMWPSRPDAYWYEPRFKGYRRAMEEAGLEPLPLVLAPYLGHPVRSREEFDAGIRILCGLMTEHLTGPNSVDAILTISDATSSETAKMLRMFHKEPNVDVDIAGYDNIWAEYNDPYADKVLPIVTVDKSNYAIGKMLAQMLVDRCDGLLDSAPVIKLVAQRVLKVAVENNSTEDGKVHNEES